MEKLFSKTDGLRFSTGTRFVTPSGKIAGHSVRMIGGTFLVTNVQDRISIRALVWMCRLRFAITWVLASKMRVTGSSSSFAKYLAVRGPRTVTTTHLSFSGARVMNGSLAGKYRLSDRSSHPGSMGEGEEK